jgi:hypothetical protein
MGRGNPFGVPALAGDVCWWNDASETWRLAGKSIL